MRAVWGVRAVWTVRTARVRVRMCGVCVCTRVRTWSEVCDPGNKQVKTHLVLLVVPGHLGILHSSVDIESIRCQQPALWIVALDPSSAHASRVRIKCVILVPVAPAASALPPSGPVVPAAEGEGQPARDDAGGCGAMWECGT